MASRTTNIDPCNVLLSCGLGLGLIYLLYLLLNKLKVQLQVASKKARVPQRLHGWALVVLVVLLVVGSSFFKLVVRIKAAFKLRTSYEKRRAQELEKVQWYSEDRRTRYDYFEVPTDESLRAAMATLTPAPWLHSNCSVCCGRLMEHSVDERLEQTCHFCSGTRDTDCEDCKARFEEVENTFCRRTFKELRRLHVTLPDLMFQLWDHLNATLERELIGEGERKLTRNEKEKKRKREQRRRQRQQMTLS